MAEKTPPRATPYVGRFAPSPSGPLHFGSLLAAVGSYLRARQAGGRWLLRIEDLDPPREVPGATTLILASLEAFGFEWDGETVYQSQRTRRYRDALAALHRQVFWCDCSRRKAAADSRRLGLPDGVYAGTCRDRGLSAHPDRAARFRSQTSPAFDDLLQGHCQFEPAGDFVIWRRADLPAYFLAVSVDDGVQGISEVVRGCDLLDSTPRQIALMRALGLAIPDFLHLPVALAGDGHKLSKQTGAAALVDDDAAPQLCAALTALGAPPPVDLKTAKVAEIWRWAIASWSLKPLKGIKTLAPARV